MPNSLAHRMHSYYQNTCKKNSLDRLTQGSMKHKATNKVSCKHTVQPIVLICALQKNSAYTSSF